MCIDFTIATYSLEDTKHKTYKQHVTFKLECNKNLFEEFWSPQLNTKNILYKCNICLWTINQGVKDFIMLTITGKYRYFQQSLPLGTRWIEIVKNWGWIIYDFFKTSWKEILKQINTFYWIHCWSIIVIFLWWRQNSDIMLWGWK